MVFTSVMAVFDRIQWWSLAVEQLAPVYVNQAVYDRELVGEGDRGGDKVKGNLLLSFFYQDFLHLPVIHVFLLPGAIGLAVPPITITREVVPYCRCNRPTIRGLPKVHC